MTTTSGLSSHPVRPVLDRTSINQCFFDRFPLTKDGLSQCRAELMAHYELTELDVHLPRNGYFHGF